MAGTAQMSLYQDLPFSLCQSGPERVDGVGNYYLQILAPLPSQLPLSTIYFLDSHGQIPSKIKDPDYAPIQQSQIDWVTCTSEALRQDRRQNDKTISGFHAHPGPRIRRQRSHNTGRRTQRTNRRTEFQLPFLRCVGPRRRCSVRLWTRSCERLLRSSAFTARWRQNLWSLAVLWRRQWIWRVFLVWRQAIPSTSAGLRT